VPFKIRFNNKKIQPKKPEKGKIVTLQIPRVGVYLICNIISYTLSGKKIKC
jgi:hypothetical protein